MFPCRYVKRFWPFTVCAAHPSGRDDIVLTMSGDAGVLGKLLNLCMWSFYGGSGCSLYMYSVIQLNNDHNVFFPVFPRALREEFWRKIIVT